MNSSMRNMLRDESAKRSTAVSQVEIDANRKNMREAAAQAVEGLRKLGLRKLARKNKVAA